MQAGDRLIPPRQNDQMHGVADSQGRLFRSTLTAGAARIGRQTIVQWMPDQRQGLRRPSD